MSRVVVRTDIERILSKQPGLVAALGKATDRIENEAVRLASPVSQRFADGIDSGVDVDSLGMFGRVNANWWGSLFVEFGTVTQPPRAILRRALDTATSR